MPAPPSPWTPPALPELVLAEESWSALGLDALYGTVMLTSTDPMRSNSGNQFASLCREQMI